MEKIALSLQAKGEKPQKKSTLLISWIQTSILQNCETINLSRFIHPVCGTLYGSPSRVIY